MAAAGLFIDSDVFLLLAGAAKIEDAIRVLGFEPSRCHRLQPLPHMLDKSRLLRARYSESVRSRAKIACRQVPALLERPSGELMQRFLDIEGVNPGEALLYALLAERSGYLLASGDKIAMRAIGSDAKAGDLRALVAGRVICLESMVRRLVVKDGAAAVASSFRDVLDSNTTLRVVFTEVNVKQEGRCLAGLDSYVADLQLQVGNGFLYFP